MSRSFTLCAVFLVSLSMGGGAFAYTHIGSRWRSSNRPVTFAVNTDQAPSGFAGAVRRAARTWSNQSQLDFAFQDQGSTNIRRSALNDRVHSIYWSPQGSGMDQTTLAATMHWSRGNEMVHFDMVFNGRHNWSTNPNRWQFDLEAVALHEFGHALGLDHSHLWQAVMYPSTPPGVKRRALTQDDLAGAAALYPTGAAPALGPVELIAPKGSLTNARPRFRWKAVSGAESYNLRVDMLSGNQRRTLLNLGNLGGTEYSLSSALRGSTTYEWQVTAFSRDGSSRASKTQRFVVEGTTPAQPQINSPGRNVTNLRPVFSWSAVPGATAYEIWVNEANGRSGIIRLRLSGTRYQGGQLQRGQIYYWWVRAINNSGASPWTGSAFQIR